MVGCVREYVCRWCWLARWGRWRWWLPEGVTVCEIPHSYVVCSTGVSDAFQSLIGLCSRVQLSRISTSASPLPSSAHIYVSKSPNHEDCPSPPFCWGSVQTPRLEGSGHPYQRVAQLLPALPSSKYAPSFEPFWSLCVRARGTAWQQLPGGGGRESQRLVGYARLLAEMYNYSVVGSPTVFETLHLLLDSGHEVCKSQNLIFCFFVLDFCCAGGSGGGKLNQGRTAVFLLPSYFLLRYWGMLEMLSGVQ